MNKKILSLPMLLSLVIGNMIGTGIYVLPSSLAKYGTISILSWVYTGIGAIFLGLTFTYLNRRFPKTGGPYIYCKEAYGKLVGFIVAYSYWAGYWVSSAGIAVSSVGYFGFIFPLLNANSPSYNQYWALVIEVGCVWMFTLINIIGIYFSGVFQLMITVVKIIPLFIIIIFGFSHIRVENLVPFIIGSQSGFITVSSAAALTFWAFLGLESATVPAENTKGHRVIFKATMYGTLITSLIYILSTFVLMGMMSSTPLQKSSFPFAVVGNQLFGMKSAYLIVGCAIISGLGALNSCILIQGQVMFAAARDNLFPRVFSKRSKTDAPVYGQVFTSGLVTLLLIVTINPNGLKQFDTIALLAAFLLLVVYLISALSELKFLFLQKKSFFSCFINRALWVVFMAVAYSGWMILNLDLKIIFLGFFLLLICIPIYFLKVKKYDQLSVTY